MSMKKIRFVDNGQDFLEWIIKDGKVISCKPYQECNGPVFLETF